MPTKLKKKLDKDLELITSKTIEMSHTVKQAYIDLKEVLETNNKEMAIDIVRADQSINELEEEIMEDSIRVIALQSPVASDLRLIVSSFSIASQLERIADYAVNVADYVLVIDDTRRMPVTPTINAMLNHIVQMFDVAIEAYAQQDLQLAKEVARMDQELDEMYQDALEQVVQLSDAAEELATYNMKTTLIVKYLERAGDHMTNTAESVAYIINGRSYEFNTGIGRRRPRRNFKS